MLYHQSIRRELGKNFAATLVVLSIVVLTMMLIRVLGLASRGVVSPTDVLLVLAYTMTGHFSTLLTLCLFVSIVHTLSRMAVDHEMVIWHSSGKGLVGMVSPVLQFAWPILIGIGILTLLAWPWSNQQSQILRNQFEQRSDLDRVVPGQFQESADGSRVFFIDNVPEDSTKRSNLFIYEVKKNAESIVTAKSGEIQTINNRQYLVLDQGQRIAFKGSGGGFETVEFEKLGFFVKHVPFVNQGDDPPKASSTLNLLTSDTLDSLGELSWRLGIICAGFNFCFLGIALSAKPINRQRRSIHFLAAIFVFVTYYNFINVGQSWINAGRIPFWGWLLALHGSVALLSCLWLAARHNAFHLASGIVRWSARSTS